MNQEFFLDILDKNEKIIETFKPNHKRFVVFTILRNLIASLIVSVIPLIFIIAPACSNNYGVELIGIITVPIILLSIIVIGFISSVIIRVVVYKKTFYCCTNKRAIVRRGFIKADYQILNYNQIGGVELTTDYLDKICKQNTGTISFVAVASSDTEKKSAVYFAHIENVHETYKKIKEYSSISDDKFVSLR